MSESFDRFAADYDHLLDEGIRVSGETKDFFARARLVALQKQLTRYNARVESVLDFGCGTGSATPLLFEILGVKKVLGLDASGEMIELARQKYGSERSRFLRLGEHEGTAAVDLVYCNGVFHHIPVGERNSALAVIGQFLQPSGLFSLWENNPWNPGAAYIMKRCAFDRDAEMITPPAARKTITAAGFRILQTDYHFIFPRFLRALRVFEPLVQNIPLGAQYHVFARNGD